MTYSHCCEVEPGLWIGDSVAAETSGPTAGSPWGLVVNCTQEVPFSDGIPEGSRFRVAVLDIEDRRDHDEMLRQFPLVNARVRACLADSRPVLVHCVAGRQRSAAVVAAFLMSRDGLDPSAAIARVKSVRREAFWPYANFMPSLVAYHERQTGAHGA